MEGTIRLATRTIFIVTESFFVVKPWSSFLSVCPKGANKLERSAEGYAARSALIKSVAKPLFSLWKKKRLLSNYCFHIKPRLSDHHCHIKTIHKTPDH